MTEFEVGQAVAFMKGGDGAYVLYGTVFLVQGPRVAICVDDGLVYWARVEWITAI